MNNLTTYSDQKLQTIVNARETSGVLREMCYRELQTRFRDKHNLRAVPLSSEAVLVRPLIQAGVRYGKLHLVVSGSREGDIPALREAVPHWVRHVVQYHGVFGRSYATIYVGCARGVDVIVRETFEHKLYPADWQGLGKRAGMVRNGKMLDAAERGANLDGGRAVLLAFPLPGGRGTQACIAEARKRGLETWVISPERWDFHGAQ